MTDVKNILPELNLRKSEMLHITNFKMRLVEFHRKYSKDTRLLFDDRYFNLVINWQRDCFESNLYDKLSYTIDSAYGIRDSIIIEAINNYMPKDKYIVFADREGIWLDNRNLLNELLTYLNKSDAEIYFHKADFIIGINNKVFIWRESSTDGWYVKVPK